MVSFDCIPSNGHHLLAPGGAEPDAGLLDPLHHLKLCEGPQRQKTPGAHPHHLGASTLSNVSLSFIFHLS